MGAAHEQEFRIANNARDTLHHQGNAVAAGVRQKYAQFCRLIARAHILDPDQAFDDLPDLAKQMLAGGVAKLLVDRLDFGELEIAHRESSVMGLAFGNQVGHVIEEKGTGRQFGHRVDGHDRFCRACRGDQIAAIPPMADPYQSLLPEIEDVERLKQNVSDPDVMRLSGGLARPRSASLGRTSRTGRLK